MSNHPEITVGARVKYSRAFLRSISCYTGSVPFLRGTVIAIQTFHTESPALATVQWDEEHSAHIFVTNLWPCAKDHLEPV